MIVSLWCRSTYNKCYIQDFIDMKVDCYSRYGVSIIKSCLKCLLGYTVMPNLKDLSKNTNFLYLTIITSSPLFK